MELIETYLAIWNGTAPPQRPARVAVVVVRVTPSRRHIGRCQLVSICERTSRDELARRNFANEGVAMSKRATGRAGSVTEQRLGAATPLRGLLNKVFPDHWSFLLGEIMLYSFVALAVTGVVLALFFDPSARDAVYDGSYAPLRGTHMSAAYASTVDISFDVRGGLLMRQMHHWAALLFIAACIGYLLRVFFTGAFRRPRRLKWTAGLLVFWIGVATSYTGYMMLDDGMSGTGMQILQGILLSIPVVGTWLASSIFGGEFPGDVIIGRLYLLHVLLLPALLVVLLSVLIGLRLRLRPARWRGARGGVRFFPQYTIRQGGLLVFVFAVVALLGGLFGINPVWIFGPARAADVSALSQPAWYVMFLDGAVRLMPPWELTIPIGAGYTVPPIFWAAVVLPGLLVALPMAYPRIEARVRRDHRVHHLLDRPRDAPGRTALGAMAVTFYLVLTAAGAADAIALTFNISTNALTWAGRIGLVVLPPLAYRVTHRICLGLQQHDRQVLAHGVETGIIRRLPDGGFTELHQPLATPYAGLPVPKKTNHLGPVAPAPRPLDRHRKAA